MRNPGSRPQRRKSLARNRISGPILAGVLLALPGFAAAGELRPYTVTGDAIPLSLTGAPGDPVRGRATTVNRQSTCILCHNGPFPEEKFQGDLAPNLAGSGSDQENTVITPGSAGNQLKILRPAAITRKQIADLGFQWLAEHQPSSVFWKSFQL